MIFHADQNNLRSKFINMQLHTFKNTDELSTHVADWLTDFIQQTLQTQDRFTIALSGGNTPKKLHELLTTDNYKNKIDWSKLHIFFGDERFVPITDEKSNAKMAFDTLLNHVPVPASQIHIMQTKNISPEDSAEEYEKILRQYFSSTPFSFDLVFLGMGDDGHTLSLFPGQTKIIHEEKKWADSLWLQTQNMYRITLTHSIVNNSKHIAFLVAGADKANALHEVLKGNYNPDLYPSQIIKPANGELHWFTDEAATAKL
jgi:6-phosphogluconolactonase